MNKMVIKLNCYLNTSLVSEACLSGDHLLKNIFIVIYLFITYLFFPDVWCEDIGVVDHGCGVLERFPSERGSTF